MAWTHIVTLTVKKAFLSIYAIRFLFNGSMNKGANYVYYGLKCREVFSFL